jgi:prepilin-type N-terminal cleavage/methylation domain-containing protein
MRNRPSKKQQKGFSLLELLVSVAILVIVAGAIIMAMIRMTWSESTIMNRTQMHSSVRNATELMQQEVGQAGRVGAQPGLQLTTAITVPAGSSSVVATSTITTTATTTGAAGTDGLYPGEQLVVDPSANTTTSNEETVTITSVNYTSHTVTATFLYSHAANVPALVLGGFASGIVPPTGKFVYSGTGASNTTLTAGTTDGSTGQILKLYGDINGDGSMYYVVYKCSPNTSGNGTLKRYLVQDVNFGTANTLGNSGTVLLDTLYGDPSTTCFTYTTKDVGVTINNGLVTQTFVVNVAVTLTVQTPNVDQQTGVPQRETKALLNIAPRNVFDAWELAGDPSGYTRAQPMPSNVLNPLLSATLN